jgi:hypothetical protein
MHTSNGSVVLVGAMVLSLLAAGPGQAGQMKDKNDFAGLWQYTDPRLDEVVTTVLMLPDGRCKEYGPLHLLRQANCYTYQNGKLTWYYAVTGMGKKQVLAGKLQWESTTKFRFEVTEGFEGQKFMPGPTEQDLLTKWTFSRRLTLKPSPEEQKKTLVGEWDCCDARGGQSVMTLECTVAGGCKAKGFATLNAVNKYTYENGVVELLYAVSGGGQDLVVGIPQWDGSNRFALEIVGSKVGLSCGTKLICTRK